MKLQRGCCKFRLHSFRPATSDAVSVKVSPVGPLDDSLNQNVRPAPPPLSFGEPLGEFQKGNDDISARIGHFHKSACYYV